MMTKRSKLVALLAVGTMAVAGCGDDGDSGTSAAKTAGNGTDRAFVAEMIPHHQSAVEMAQIALKRGDSSFVKGLAEDIVRTQKAEIAALRREDAQLAEAGVNKGALGVPAHMMGMGEDTDQLKTATPFDDPFIKMMVPHHKGAIEMAKVELAKGTDPELKTLAQQIIDAQQREIEEMTGQLAKASAAPRKETPNRAGIDSSSADRSSAVAGRQPARTTAIEAAAAGTGPRDLPVTTASK